MKHSTPGAHAFGGTLLPFRRLYHNRQSGNEVEPLSWYLTDAEELSWVSRINIKRSLALSKTHLRGLVILHKPGFMPHEMTANYTIVIAHGLSPEEERFVAIKELMHIYFGPDGGGTYATTSEIELENLINEMFVGSVTTRSNQYQAEGKALWMAMAVLCRENTRRELAAKADGRDEYYKEVAERLRITENRARILLSDRYEAQVGILLS